MASSQFSRTPRSLADDLRSRTPGQIRRLLDLRPDLLSPWPTDISQLARRAADDASVLEAMGGLSTRALRVLEVYAALVEADTATVGRALAEDIGAVVADLWERALLWGGPVFRIVRAAQQAFGPYPCGLSGASHLTPDPETVRADALDLDPDRLRYLVWEHPVSTTSNALTVVRGEQNVVPREVALILRDGLYLPEAPRPAEFEPLEVVAQPWNALAGIRYVITDLRREPLAWHPQKGVSRRSLQDRAEQMSVPFDDLVAWVELAAVAGLIGAAGSRAAPTSAGIGWLRAGPQVMWTSVVRAWLDSDRPLLRCRPDELGCLTTAGVPRTAVHRRLVLAALPPARLAPDDVRELLTWQLPRMVQARDQLPDFLAELTALGLLVAGVAGPDLVHATQLIVPGCDNGLIVQPDHTVIAPANVDVATWELLHDIARVESWGPVVMHRIDTPRLRQALAVRTADDVLAHLGDVSRTPLPQSLEYTVRDATRGRPVQIRRETVIRGAVLEADVVRDLGWQEIAPEVFATQAPLEVVRAALVERGVAVTAGEQPVTAPELDYPREHAHDPGAVDRLVAHLVEGPSDPGVAPELAAADPGTLREALVARRVWLEFTDGQQTLTHLVEPLEVRSGSLTGWSLSASRSVSIPLSRIAALRIVDD